MNKTGIKRNETEQKLNILIKRDIWPKQLKWDNPIIKQLTPTRLEFIHSDIWRNINQPFSTKFQMTKNLQENFLEIFTDFWLAEIWANQKSLLMENWKQIWIYFYSFFESFAQIDSNENVWETTKYNTLCGKTNSQPF